MAESTSYAEKSTSTDKWIALEDGKVIAEGIDLSEVYVNAMIVARSKPQFKRIHVA